MDHKHTPEEERRIRDAALDDTLAETFPASDPPSTLPNPCNDAFLGNKSNAGEQQPSTGVDRDDDSASAFNRPEDVVNAFVEAWNRRDPDALAALFDEDAEFVNVTGLWWHTREEIRKAHAYGLTQIFQNSFLQVTDVRVKRLSDEVAVVHSRMVLSGQSPVNEISGLRPRSNVMSFVIHRTKAGWRCASAHNTDIIPGSETNIIDDNGRLQSVSYRDRS